MANVYKAGNKRAKRAILYSIHLILIKYVLPLPISNPAKIAYKGKSRPTNTYPSIIKVGLIPLPLLTPVKYSKIEGPIELLNTGSHSGERIEWKK